MTQRLTMKALHDRIGVAPGTPGYGTVFGPMSRKALDAKLSNPKAPAATLEDFKRVAADLNVPIALIRAVRKVEAPRGPFDERGRPSILYERHKFYENTRPPGLFTTNSNLSWKTGYGRGGYGSFSAQYDKLYAACALDPHAAFAACSWGAFQVLGENADAMKYGTPLDMALALTQGEPAHLDCFARFVRMKKLEDELRACRPGNAESCIPFVRRYNGEGFREFNYHATLADAALAFTK